MDITCISDLHGEFPELQGGDLLIIAGDCTSNNSVKAWHNFFDWLREQKYKYKIIVAGNHDNFCMEWAVPEMIDGKKYETTYEERMLFHYLCDSGLELEGLKIWGSPWSRWFSEINPKCSAFTGTEVELQKHFDNIPRNVDILITHTPPCGILDKNKWNQNCGHIGLRNMVLNGNHFTNLKYHIFGHIHEQGSKIFKSSLTTFINASIMNEDYEAVNKPIRITL